MKALLMSLTMSLGLLMAGAGHAQAPAAAPAGSTGLCKDGSYTTGATKRGACRGHQGVKEWYAATPSAAADSEAAPKTKRSAKRSASDMSAAPAASAGSAMAVPKTSATSNTSTATAAPASAPAGSTGLCKDGSYYSGDAKRGACRGHKGVKEWYGAAAAAGAGTAAAATTGASMPATPPAAATPKMPAPATPAAAPNRSSAAPADEPESRAAAPGGGAGKVWVNTASKVYHCQDDRYYGKTKQGEYMSEADAIAKGSHASHGKSCGK